jgi:gas vesicle protein
MDENENENVKTTSIVPFVLGGFALGAVCGVLFAPKKGSELRADMKDWGRKRKLEGAELYDRVKHLLPTPTEIADAIDGARDAGRIAIRHHDKDGRSAKT